MLERQDPERGQHGCSRFPHRTMKMGVAPSLKFKLGKESNSAKYCTNTQIYVQNMRLCNLLKSFVWIHRTSKKLQTSALRLSRKPWHHKCALILHVYRHASYVGSGLLATRTMKPHIIVTVVSGDGIVPEIAAALGKVFMAADVSPNDFTQVVTCALRKPAKESLRSSFRRVIRKGGSEPTGKESDLR